MAIALVLRIVIYFQNRNLFIDEANVARNVFERSFTGLIKPLDYEQFAPPLFLWITKLSTLFFGMNEWALRLFPLLSSIVAFFVLLEIIKQWIPKQYAWYAMALFSSGYLFIHYATELKQYSSDFLISSILIYLALKLKTQQFKSIIAWILVGFLAIFTSMPSIFILFSIGLYWFYSDFKLKNVEQFKIHLSICLFWLIGFVLYYFLILNNQIQSDYLQKYHADSFLNFPTSLHHVNHNVKVLSGIITQAGGGTFIAILINIVLLFIGIIFLHKYKTKYNILLLSPFIVLIVAGISHKYAMVSRLLLFIQPIIFIFLSLGVYVVFKSDKWWLKMVVFIVLILNIYNHQELKYLFKKFEFQEIHYALDALNKPEKFGANSKVLVHHGAVPAFIFYTQMKDNSQQYALLKNKGTLMEWNSSYSDSIDKYPNSYILLSNYYEEEKNNLQNKLNSKFSIEIDKPGCLLFSTN